MIYFQIDYNISEYVFQFFFWENIIATYLLSPSMKSPSQLKKERLKKLFKTLNDESKVPIILEPINSSIKLEKPLTLVIDPESSFKYFAQTVSKKLEYMGTSKMQSVFYYCQGQQLTNFYSTMGDIFDKYRSQEGWLELKIAGDSPF